MLGMRSQVRHGYGWDANFTHKNEILDIGSWIQYDTGSWPFLKHLAIIAYDRITSQLPCVAPHCLYVLFFAVILRLWRQDFCVQHLVDLWTF